MARRAISGAVASALALAGCATGPAVLYEGPPREPSEIAVVRRAGRGNLRVVRIDDFDTGGFEWHVEPGAHRLWVELKMYGDALNVSYSAWTWCAIDFEAEAGWNYQVVSESGQRRQAVDTEVTLGFRMVDGQGQLVGTPAGCFDRRPAFASP